jgi:hypothetical protein
MDENENPFYMDSVQGHSRRSSKNGINSENFRREYYDDEQDYEYQDLSDVDISHELQSEDLGKLHSPISLNSIKISC